MFRFPLIKARAWHAHGSAGRSQTRDKSSFVVCCQWCEGPEVEAPKCVDGLGTEYGGLLLYSLPKETPMVRFAGIAAVFALGFGTSMLISQGMTKTERFPQFENDEVKVWKTVVQPHVPLPLHRHDHGRVIIALSGGTMNVVSSMGEIEAHPWETGKAYWLPKMAPGAMHTDENAGDKPIEVMVVELKNDK
jgi:hypothetical protein